MKNLPAAGVILCGGQSKRMGGVVKAQLKLGDHTLLGRVIDRVSPQVNQVVLSVEQPSDHFSAYGLKQIADPMPGHNGPLGGLVSALKATAESHEWLLLVPCDAPFLPSDLARRLHEHALRLGESACVVSYDGVVQPTFSIWNRCLLPSLESAVLVDRMAGFMQYLKRYPQGILEWEKSDISPFFNLNDRAAFVQAEHLINSGTT